ILRGVRQQQDEPGRFSICSRQAAVVHIMKLLIVAFVTLCLAGCQASHKLPPVSGKSEPVNSAEVMQNGI
ncbi:hypothetical protein, partial [Escherichia coli]|uniref:hypothetical protein n=1 Tax=Escherichia coli TaxID=562 RepID=UPI002F2B490E